jgi:toxin ParE1/3/4
MPRLLRSPRAQEDLIELWTYIAADDPAAADRLLEEIEDKLLMLATRPRLGPSRPDIAPGLRLFPVRRYVILYRELADGIEVGPYRQVMRVQTA